MSGLHLLTRAAPYAARTAVFAAEGRFTCRDSTVASRWVARTLAGDRADLGEDRAERRGR